MCFVLNPASAYSPTPGQQPSAQRHYKVDITVTASGRSDDRAVPSASTYRCDERQAAYQNRQALITMLEKYVHERKKEAAQDSRSNPCRSSVQHCCDDFMNSVYGGSRSDHCTDRSDGYQSSSAMMAALLTTIIKQLQALNEDHCERDHHRHDGCRDQPPASQDISRLLHPSQAYPGSYNILNDGPGQQKRLRATGEFMDAHRSLFGKPHAAPGEDGSWTGELLGRGDDVLSGSEFRKVQLANDLRCGKYTGNYNNIYFQRANGLGEINTGKYKEEDLKKLAQFMDAAGTGVFPITGRSRNWMEELVTRTEGNNTLDRIETQSVKKAIALLNELQENH